MTRFLLPLLLVACGGKDDPSCPPGTTPSGDACAEIQGGGDADTDADTDADADADTDGDPDGPDITAFEVDPTALTQGELVTFTLAVTAPADGATLTGGQLVGPGGATYGLFRVPEGDGVYRMDLAWPDIHVVGSIDFDAGGHEDRTFTAYMSDDEGRAGSATTTLRLHCDGDAACSGQCTDVSDDVDHCGACGERCDVVMGDRVCDAGACATRAACAVLPAATTCSDVCAAAGARACAPARGFYKDPICDDVLDEQWAVPCDTPLGTLVSGAVAEQCACFF
jgi:hypothetical protein